MAATRKTITIPTELNEKLVKYQEEHKLNPVNVSRICRNAIENHLNDYGGL